MVRYSIYTIYKCGRTKTHNVEAENKEVMWEKFYKKHNKNTIEEAVLFSEKKL